jgi:hypothetical protein
MSTLTRKIVLVWLAWAAIIFIYQEMIPARFDIARPDYAVPWTPSETIKGSQDSKVYLTEPFLNTHVAWDSEFYLQQAVGGFDDPHVRMIPGPGPEGMVSLGYAFYPLYGAVTWLISLPLRIFQLSEIATATLAALVVSLLGTLAALLALADLARPWLEESGGLRAAFYLLIFPTGFFLAQVYTEGLFVGLAFSSLALIQRKKLLWAGVLAALAVWTRAVGVALVIPLGLELVRQVWARRKIQFNRPTLAAAAAALLPVLSFGGFWFSILGERFRFMEEAYFGRGLLLVGKSIGEWIGALTTTVLSLNSQALVYNTLEIAIILISLVAALALVRRYPGVALFSLAVWAISVFSGSPQSVSRYVLAMPTTFLALARLGKSEAFDRGWTLASILLMGMEAALFSFDMWVG